MSAILNVRVDGVGSYALDWDLQSKTVGDLKLWLVENVGIPVDQQILKFLGGIVLQDNNQPLSSLGVIDGFEVIVQDSRHDQLPVSVQRLSGGELITLVMSRREDTILTLKQKIEQVDGLDVSKQVIRRDGVGCSDGTFLSRYLRGGMIELQLEIRIDIRLNVFTGESIVTNVAAHELVSVVEQRVQQRLRVPTYHQELMFNDQIMPSESHLHEHGVKEGSDIQVQLKQYEMTIFFKTLTRHTIMITVTSRDTVLDVKRKVMIQEGIPIEKQRIIFTGIQLNNHERFLAYRIELESAVHIVLRVGDSYELTVRTPTGRTRSVEIQPTSKVQYIRDRMFDLEGIAKDIQKLYFNGRLLEDDEATMQECGITVEDCSIELRIDGNRSTQIFASFRSRGTRTLWVDPDYTVADLKQMIATKENLPADDLEIFFTRIKLENERTLRSYVIESNHMIHIEISPPPVVRLRIKVHNDVDANDFDIQVPNNMTIDSVKREIMSRKKYPVPTQQLFSEGRELSNTQKVKACDLESGSVLDLVLAAEAVPHQTPTAMHLFVKTLTGKTITIETSLTDTVLQLKQKIYVKEGLAVESQCLVLAGKQMENTESVGSVGIQNQSVIHLVLRVPTNLVAGDKLFIEELTTGFRDFEMDVNLLGTVRELKGRIEELKNVPVDEQTLLYEGRVLSDEQTLEAQRITDGLSIQLLRKE